MLTGPMLLLAFGLFVAWRVVPMLACIAITIIGMFALRVMPTVLIVLYCTSLSFVWFVMSVAGAGCCYALSWGPKRTATGKQRERMYRIHGTTCRVLGCRRPGAQADHIIPRKPASLPWLLGGPSWVTNFKPVCGPARAGGVGHNQRKSNNVTKGWIIGDSPRTRTRR